MDSRASQTHMQVPLPSPRPPGKPRRGLALLAVAILCTAGAAWYWVYTSHRSADGPFGRSAPEPTATIDLRSPVAQAMVATVKRLGYESWDVYDAGATRSRSRSEAYNELVCYTDHDGHKWCYFLALRPTGRGHWQVTRLELNLYTQDWTPVAISNARKGSTETTYRGLLALTQAQGPGDYDKDPSLISTRLGMRVFAGDVLVEALHTNECEEGFWRGCVPDEPGPVEPEVDALLEEAARAGLIEPGLLR